MSEEIEVNRTQVLFACESLTANIILLVEEYRHVDANLLIEGRLLIKRLYKLHRKLYSESEAVFIEALNEEQEISRHANAYASRCYRVGQALLAHYGIM